MQVNAESLAAVIVVAMKKALAPVVAELAEMKTHVRALETREPVPGPVGPVGPAGRNGIDGHDGSDGADGVGFDDLAVALDGRTLTLTFRRGDVVKTFPLELPTPTYRGVFKYGTDYRVGDMVTHGGSTWHCDVPTALPPREELREWSLMVRRGRDGKRP